MSKSAQRTDTLAHIRPAGTQKVAHRVVQTKHGSLGDFGAKVPSYFSDPLPKWARSPLENSKNTPCDTCFPKVNSVVVCLKLIGVNPCLRLSLSTEHFCTSSDMLNDLHLSVVGTTSIAGHFVAPAILILQILICSL